MASFTGYMADDSYVSEQQRGHITRNVDNPFKRFNAWVISTYRAYLGSASLKLFPSGIYTLDVAVDSGYRYLYSRAWAPINGQARIDLLNPETGEIIASDLTSSEDEWEQLMIGWAADAKVYLLYMRHMGSTQMVEGTDPSVYFDVIEVV